MSKIGGGDRDSDDEDINRASIAGRVTSGNMRELIDKAMKKDTRQIPEEELKYQFKKLKPLLPLGFNPLSYGLFD